MARRSALNPLRDGLEVTLEKVEDDLAAEPLGSVEVVGVGNDRQLCLGHGFVHLDNRLQSEHLIAVTEVDQYRAGEGTQLLEAVVLHRVPQLGDLSEKLLPVVGLAVTDVHGTEVVNPAGVGSLHLLQVNRTGAREAPSLQAVEVLVVEPVGGSGDDQCTRQAWMAERQLEGDLSAVAIAQ